jgi:hypothetical protein
MRRRGQNQSSGADSVNNQAGRDLVQMGVSAAEARDIALDVYKSNFLTLSGIAEQVALDRAERITREFLERLQREDAKSLSSVQDPDMQHVIFTAQAGFARSGEADLEQSLVDLLVDRAGQQERDLKTLVLNAAIEILPKLTVAQRRAITVCFLVRYTRYVGHFGLADFYSYVEQWKPVLDIGSVKRADYQHVQSAGAGSLGAFGLELGAAFADAALGFFTRGFTAEDVPDDLREFLNDSDVFIPCLRDPTKIQINARASAEIDEMKVDKQIGDVLKNLSNVGVMGQPKIVEDLVTHIPEMAIVRDRWEPSGLQNFELTAAGMAIGHAYWRHITPAGDLAPLDNWLRG